MNNKVTEQSFLWENFQSRWLHMAHWIFFGSLFFLFCGAVFVWYGTVFAPTDRTEELKQEILRSEQEGFDVEALEGVLQSLENRSAQSVQSKERRDIFFQ